MENKPQELTSQQYQQIINEMKGELVLVQASAFQQLRSATDQIKRLEQQNKGFNNALVHISRRLGVTEENPGMDLIVSTLEEILAPKKVPNKRRTNKRNANK